MLLYKYVTFIRIIPYGCYFLYIAFNPYSEKAAHMSGDLAQLILEEALYSITEL